MPIIKTQNETPQIPIIHYNKSIHALLFILICVVIAGGVVFYQINKTSEPEPVTSVQVVAPEITPEQRTQALVEVRGAIVSAPAVTDIQRQSALKEVRKSISQQ